MMLFTGVIQILISVVLNVIVILYFHQDNHLLQVMQVHTIVTILLLETHLIWVYLIVGEVVIKHQDQFLYRLYGKEHLITHVQLVQVVGMTQDIHVHQMGVNLVGVIQV
jgi:hypothetical protein